MKAKYIPYIIIVVLIVYIFIARECGNPKPCPPIPKPTVDTIKVPVDRPYPVPQPYAVIDSYPYNTPVDTAKILKDYYQMRFYDRLLCDDSIGTLRLVDTVYKNRLRGFALRGHRNAIEKTSYVEVYKPMPLHNRVFIGLEIGSNLNGLSLIPIATLLTKKDKTLYSIGYDPFQKYGYIGVQYKIILKQNK